jgi:regulator of RNase E activity RraA
VSKSHPEQWVVREVAERPDRSLVAALRELATTQIADCGGPVAVVAPPLRHLAGGAQVCGPAVTVWTKPGVVRCGGVTVRPGDVVRGDASGLVIVPKEHLAPVLAMTETVANRERDWRRAIAGGASLPAATGIDDLISQLAADRAAGGH